MKMFETNKYIKTLENKFCKILTEDEIKEIQQIVLGMMVDLNDIFQRYDIKYYLGGGSALGAIRHKGFIPWDEDMDINMFRKDYEKLIKIFDEEPRLYEKYYLCENSYDNEFDVNFMKIKLKGTVFQEYLYSDYNKDGVFIDIFPVENVPNNKILQKLHGYLIHGMLFICSCIRFYKKKEKYLSFGNDIKYVKAVKKKARIGKIASAFGRNFWLRISKKIMTMCKNENSNYLSVPTGRKHYFGEMIRRNEVQPLKWVPFENIELPVAKDNATYMSNLYGDYMKIPEVSKRERHYIYKIDLKNVRSEKE